MIDDPQTCDVCGEEFNEDRPHMKHQKKEEAASADPSNPAKGDDPAKA